MISALLSENSPSYPDYKQLWQHVSLMLKDHLGKDTHKSWIEPIHYKEFKEGRLVLAVPTRFLGEWVRQNCEDRIRALCHQHSEKILGVEFMVIPRHRTEKETITFSPMGPQQTSEEAPNKGADGAAETVSVPLDPRFIFDHFVVGKSNELAFAAAHRVADATEVTFNPLFLYGGVGLGKTHLMHAIAWHIQKTHPQRRVIYMSAEQFMYHFIRALRFKNAVAFKDTFRSVDVLMIDDVQFISGKESTQEEFFHTFNAIVDQNRQVIVSADKSPSDLEGMEERLKSRLGWGLVADIHPTTYELRLGILQARVAALGAFIPQDVLTFLAQKITANVRELEGALNRLLAHGTLVKQEITLNLAQAVLQDLVRANDRQVSIEEIQKIVAEHFNIKVSDMHSARRQKGIAVPRQAAMYLAKQLTPKSLPEIGRKFGGRDHTTVLHAVRRVNALKKDDHSFLEDIQLITRRLQAR